MKENKSILFVGGRFGIGGVERVTEIMAHAFVDDGWKVGIAAFEFSAECFTRKEASDVIVEELSFPAFRLGNLLKLRRLMKKLQPGYVINQWALPFPLTLMLRIAMPQGCRLINFFHTMPGFNKAVSESRGVKKRILALLVRLNFRLVYLFSDAYVVLAQCYKSLFCKIAGLNRADRLFALPNPVEQDLRPSVLKEKVLLYVGRLALTEKRVDRIVEAWKLLARELTDWRLEIVGDGPDREAIESLAKSVPRVIFKGFQNPIDYYARSKMLLLTSDIEGFGLVLIEGMYHGCVPVVLDSFPVAKEIVCEDSGVVVPMPWSADRYANVIRALACDDERLAKMSECARNVAEKYSVANIKQEYYQLLGAI